jgi:hypothetical protein
MLCGECGKGARLTPWAMEINAALHGQQCDKAAELSLNAG